MIDDPAMLTDKDNLTAIRAIVNPSAKKNTEMFGAAEKLTHISASHALIEKMRGIRKQGGAAGTAFGRTARTRGATSGLAMEAELKDLYGDKLSVYERGEDFSLQQREAKSAKNLGGISLIPGAFSPFTEGHARLEAIATKKKVFGVAKGENRKYDAGLSISEKSKLIQRRYPDAMTFDMSGYSAHSNYFEHGGQVYKYDPHKSEAVLGADRLSGPDSSVDRFTSKGFSIRGDETRTTSGTSIREAIYKGDMDYLKNNLSPSVFNDITANLPLLQKRAQLILGRQEKWESRTAQRQAEVDAFVAMYGDRKSKKDAPGITDARYAIKEKLAEAKAKSKGVPSSSVWRRMGLTMNFAAGGFIPNFANDITTQLREGDLSALDSITDARTLTNAYNQVSDPAVREAIAARKIKVYDDRNAKAQATRAQKMQDPLTGDTYGRVFSPTQIGYYIKNKQSRAYRIARSDEGRKYIHPTDRINLKFKQEAGPSVKGPDGKNLWGTGYESYVAQHKKGFDSSSEAGMKFSDSMNSSVDGVIGRTLVEIKGGSDYSVEFGTKKSVKEKFVRAVLENFPNKIAGVGGRGGVGEKNTFTTSPNDVIDIEGLLIYNPEARKHLKKTQRMAKGFVPNFIQRRRKMAGSSWWRSQMEKAASISVSENKDFGETTFKSAYGSGTLAKTRSGMDLSNVEIDAEHRGKGHSGDLYNAMFSHAKEQGVSSLSGVLLPQKGKFPFAALMNRVKYGKATQVSLLNGETVTVRTKEDVLNLAKSIQAADVESGLDVRTMFARGFVPNFNAISEAVKREHAAGIPMHAIRVDRHPGLVSSHNPSGTGIWNTVQETGLSDGMNKARRAGISVKTKGMAKGHVPNFADDMGGGGGVGMSMALGSLSFILPQLNLFGKGLKIATKALEDAATAHSAVNIKFQQAKTVLSDKNSKDSYGFQAALTRAGVTPSGSAIGQAKQLNAMGMTTPGMADFQSDRSRFISAAKSNQVSGRILSDMQARKDAQQDKADKASAFQGRAMAGSVIASQVSGMIPQDTSLGKATSEVVEGFGLAAQAASVLPAKLGLIAGSAILMHQGAVAIHGALYDTAPAAKKELEVMTERVSKANSSLSEYSQSIGALIGAYSNSSISMEEINRMRDKEAKALAKLTPEQQGRLAGASTPERKQAVSGQMQEENKKELDKKEREVKLKEMMDKRRKTNFSQGAAVGATVGAVAGGWAGAMKGGALGAAIGSVIPVIGTAIGGLIGTGIGAALGAGIGAGLGGKAGSKMGPKSAFDTSGFGGTWFEKNETTKKRLETEDKTRKTFSEETVGGMTELGAHKSLSVLKSNMSNEAKINKLQKDKHISETEANVMRSDPEKTLKSLEEQLIKEKSIKYALSEKEKLRLRDLVAIKKINDQIAIADGARGISLFNIDAKVQKRGGDVAQAAELKNMSQSHQRDKNLSIAGDSVEMAGMRYGAGTKLRLQSDFKRQQLLSNHQNESEARNTQGKNEASKILMDSLFSKSDSTFKTEEGKTATNEEAVLARTELQKIIEKTRAENKKTFEVSAKTDTGKDMDPSGPLSQEEANQMAAEYKARGNKNIKITSREANPNEFMAQVKANVAASPDTKVRAEMLKGFNNVGMVESINKLTEANTRAATNADAGLKNQIELEKQAYKGQMMILDEQRKGRLYGNMPTSKADDKELAKQLKKDKRGYEKGDQYATVRYAKSITDMFGDTLPQDVVGKLQSDVANASAKDRQKKFGIVSSGSHEFAQGLKRTRGADGDKHTIEKDWARARTVVRGEDGKINLPSMAKESGLGDISAFVATNNKLDKSLLSLDVTIQALNKAVQLNTVAADVVAARQATKSLGDAEVKAKADILALEQKNAQDFKEATAAFAKAMESGTKTTVEGQLTLISDKPQGISAKDWESIRQFLISQGKVAPATVTQPSQ